MNSPEFVADEHLRESNLTPCPPRPPRPLIALSEPRRPNRLQPQAQTSTDCQMSLRGFEQAGWTYSCRIKEHYLNGFPCLLSSSDTASLSSASARRNPPMNPRAPNTSVAQLTRQSDSAAIVRISLNTSRLPVSIAQHLVAITSLLLAMHSTY